MKRQKAGRLEETRASHESERDTIPSYAMDRPCRLRCDHGDHEGAVRAQARQELETFVAYAYDDVHADIARGEGQYLVSLATLAGVPATSYELFQAEMQRRYWAMYGSRVSMRDTWERVVNTAWAAGHGRAR